MLPDNTVLVKDIDTNAILYVARSLTNANAVNLGIINSLVIVLPTSLEHRRKGLLDGVNLEDDLQLYQGRKYVSLRPLPLHLLTGQHRARRALAQLRGKYLFSLEVYFSGQLNRTVDFFDPELKSFIGHELLKCKPENEVYSDAIHEYAFISEINVQTAYQELLMGFETAGVIKLRNYALFKKHAMIFNSLHTAEELDLAMKNALDDLLYKARI